MSHQVVEAFYRMLFKRARKRYEKPIFLLATFKYMLEIGLFGISLLELLQVKHTRYIKPHFERLADRRIKNPKWSWDQLTAWNRAEMKKSVEKYSSEVEDVNKAFAQLTRKDVEYLFNTLMKELEQLPEIPLEDRLS
jgi:hypothetical protein